MDPEEIKFFYIIPLSANHCKPIQAKSAQKQNRTRRPRAAKCGSA
jgi:hypothetical protein